MMLHVSVAYKQENMKNFQRATLACSVSVIAALCSIAPASAATIEPLEGPQVTTISQPADLENVSNVTDAVSASAEAKVNFDRPAITTVAAPVVAPPAVEVEAAQAPAPEAPAAAPVQVAPAQTQVAAQAVAPAQTYKASAPVTSAPAHVSATSAAPAVSGSSKGAAILSAALGQLGVQQDCTMLVTNSLRAVGINFHDWPAGYMSLGTVVPASQAQPGDLVYYANGGSGMAHIAVYAGNGKAVHGGFNGSTVLFSVNVGSGPVFIHVA